MLRTTQLDCHYFWDRVFYCFCRQEDATPHTTRPPPPCQSTNLKTSAVKHTHTLTHTHTHAHGSSQTGGEGRWKRRHTALRSWKPRWRQAWSETSYGYSRGLPTGRATLAPPTGCVGTSPHPLSWPFPLPAQSPLTAFQRHEYIEEDGIRTSRKTSAGIS